MAAIVLNRSIDRRDQRRRPIWRSGSAGGRRAARPRGANGRCPGRHEHRRVRSALRDADGTRRWWLAGISPRPKRPPCSAAPAHGGDPFDDDLAGRAPEAQQTAPVRALRHGRWPEVGGRSADRGGLGRRKTARWNPAEASARAARPADREPAPRPGSPTSFRRPACPAHRRTWRRQAMWHGHRGPSGRPNGSSDPTHTGCRVGWRWLLVGRCEKHGQASCPCHPKLSLCPEVETRRRQGPGESSQATVPQPLITHVWVPETALGRRPVSCYNRRPIRPPS